MIFLELFLTFFKIGLFTFGGGYAMLPLIQAEVVDKGWMLPEEIINFIAVSESTPGPFAINCATYVGSQMGRSLGVLNNEVLGAILGSTFATLGVVLPSFIIILIVARVFEKFKTNRIVLGCMAGLKPAVIGLIGSAVVSIAGSVFFPNGIGGFTFGTAFICSAVIYAIMQILTLKKVHPIVIILLSAVLGIAVGYIFKL